VTARAASAQYGNTRACGENYTLDLYPKKNPVQVQVRIDGHPAFCLGFEVLTRIIMKKQNLNCSDDSV
jgi:hypothetical protein